MNHELLRKELKRDEGIVLHAYADHLGYTTIGIGRLIDKRRGGGISEFEADFLLQNDIDRIEAVLNDRYFWFRKLDDVRQRALVNMAFQLGIRGFGHFTKMIAQLRAGKYRLAAQEALDSRWANQTPERAGRIAHMIQFGETGE